MKKRLLILVVLVLVLLSGLPLLYYSVINQVYARIRVDGDSMEPALPAGTFVIVNRMANDIDDFARGDIVLFRHPRNPDQEYIKRVIGLPGETVQIFSGEVTINDQVLTELYIDEAPAYAGSWTVPEGALFVLGDKRNNSFDSHNWGFVPQDSLVGKAMFVYSPAELWGFIERPAYGTSDP